MAKVGVVLSGCGVGDGSEIHEAVCVLLALDKAGAEAICMAPNIPQKHVQNHLTNQPSNETRNVLTESARIARGNIRDIAEVHADQLDAIIFPGGYGAALNLCSFASDGPDCAVNDQVLRLVREMFEAGKPVGAVCIAPALIARIGGLTGRRLTVTVGNDPGTAAAIERMGCKHRNCTVTDCVVDEANKVVTGPAYMLASGPAELYAGISEVVDAVLELVGKP